MMLTGLRRRLVVGVTMLSVVAVTVYGGGGASHAAPAARHTHAMTNVYFILNWLPNVEFAGLWVAQQKGWFRQAGINMTFKGWSPGVAPETDVPARGGTAFGFQSGAAIAIARSRGVPIEAVYADTQKSVFGLTVMANSGITSLKQLKGRKVGYQSHEFYVPATMLSCVGLSQSDWKPVVVGFDTSQLTSGHVDAYLTFITNEPIALRLQGVKTRTFHAADYCFHSNDDVMFTTTSLINSNPALVKKVTSIVARGFQWAHAHVNAATHVTVTKYFPAAKGTSATLNLRQQLLELQAFHGPSMTGPGQYHGTMTMATWRDLINTLFKYGEIRSKPNPATIFTNRFNPYM